MVLGTRLPALFHRRAINDEAYYSLVAHEMLQGGLPYRDAVDRKPPLLFSVYWAVFRIAGFPSWVALHAVAIGWTLTTMWLLYRLTAELLSPWEGLLAAALYGGFQPLLRFSNLAFNGELIMNLPACAAMLLALRRGTRGKPLDLLLAGGLVTVAFLCKQPAGIVLLPLLVYCLHPRQWRGTLAPLWRAALVVTGFALGLALAALVLHAHGILWEAWYWSVLDHELTHGPLDPVFWQIFLGAAALFVVAAGPLLLGAWWSWRNDRDRWQSQPVERDALLAWLFASMIGVSASGRFFSHYFIQLLPPLAVLAAPAFTRCWEHLRQGSPLPSRLRPALLGWSGFSILFGLGAALYDGTLRDQPLPPATAWLRSHAHPTDRLFVWGQDPHIYLDSGLRPASRDIAYYPLTGYVFGLPESWDPTYDTSRRIAPRAWEHLAEDFALHPPSYILDLDDVRAVPRYPIANYPYLAHLVAQNYRVVFRGPDAVIYARNE